MKLTPTKLQRLFLYTLPVCVFVVVVCAVGCKFKFALFMPMFAVSLAISITTIIIMAVEGNKLQKSVDKVLTENSVATKAIFNSVEIPCVLCTSQGQVVMKNTPFNALYSESSVNKLFTAEELAYTGSPYEKTVGNNVYLVHILHIQRKSKVAREVIFIYMVDISLQVHFNKLFNDTKPVVAKVYVDNYDNMSIENDMYSNTVLNKIEEKILHLTRSLCGIYRREIRSFLILFESRSLPMFEENISKFLTDIHSVTTEDGKSVSLSVGVGCEEQIDEAAELASQAIEMAMGRGGDQAVVRRSKNDSPKYYGDGKSTGELSSSRVHVRNFALNLRELILDSEDVYIIGHRDEDVDCIGSAIGLLSFINKKFSKSTYFAFVGGLSALEERINTKIPQTIAEYIITPDEAVLQATPKKSLLIIVDTQREKMLSSPGLYEALSSNVAVIDHHRRSEDAIKDTKLSFMEPAMSSTCEMITEMLHSLSESSKPISKFEATALFAGIAMDTKGFVFNTGRRTFEAAAILKKCSADTTAAMMMYQDDKERYEAIANLVEKAKVYPNRIAISVSREEIKDARTVIARAADALVSLKGIQASIVLMQLGQNVMISARSTGEINVQLICEKLGGGGHRTVAGAQLMGYTCDRALEEVKAVVNEYYEEKEKSSNESDSVEGN